MILPLSGCNFGSSPIPDPPPKLSIPLNKLNVDWDKAVADALKMVDVAVENGDLLFSLTDADIHVSDSDVVCNTTIDCYSNSSFVLRTMNYFLRALNSSAKGQDGRITDYDDNTYGGIYDVANLQIKTFSMDDDVFIDDTLAAGEHRQRGLRLSGKWLSIDMNVCYNQFRELYLSEYDPNVLNVNFLYMESDIEGNPILFSLKIAVQSGMDQQKIKETTLNVLNTFNQLCQRQDSSLSDFTPSSYGGIYDHCAMILQVYEVDGPENMDSITEEDIYYDLWLDPGEYKDLNGKIKYDKDYIRKKRNEWFEEN